MNFVRPGLRIRKSAHERANTAYNLIILLHCKHLKLLKGFMAMYII